MNILFTGTNCKSWHSKRYVHCPSGTTCFEESTFDEELNCKNKTVSDKCKTSNGNEGWLCNSGFCIVREHICDNKKDCDDGSDEAIGCNLFPDSTCNSWFGLQHNKCVIEGTYSDTYTDV